MKPNAALIYGLIASLLLVSLPHALHLPLWVSALSASLLAWRAYLTASGKKLPGRNLLLLVTLFAVGGVALSFHTLFGRDVGVMLLILLGSLKLLELHEVRDITVLIYLCCFIIVTNFFYSQSIVTALYMLCCVLIILTTWLQLQTGTLALKPRLRIASVILLQAIPLSLLLFILFPRVPGPLWGLPQDAYGSSGLSDTMAPGSLSKLTLSDAVAFRVSFNYPAPPHDKMYWRGPVLWDFDGKTWSQGRALSPQRPHLNEVGMPVSYTVTLEPHNKFWLFALDIPIRVSVPANFMSDFQLLHISPINDRLRYSAISVVEYQINRDENPQQLARALALPYGYNPRARALASEWRQQFSSDTTIVQAALNYFNQNPFVYTLEPAPIGNNSVDDFLFDTRQGFCEHYASSFVFLMRAAGIPARVVTGYQGGEFNELGNYYVLRQSDAHAWAEVWLKGSGWVRYDPTAAVAPSRVQSGLGASLPNNAALPFFIRTQSTILLKLRADLDALTNQWNQWVLGYNTELQFALLTRLGVENAHWQKMAGMLFTGFALLIAIYSLVMLRRSRPRNVDLVQQLYLKFCQRLASAGITRADHEGAQDFAQRAAQLKPQQAAEIMDITAQYLALRYQRAQDAALLQNFKRAVRHFRNVR